MACCKVCCGCKECAEGEEGKCCCGNECCAASTYCCNAECVSACSEGQAGDCKCTDACCTNSEYCCGGECVGSCTEGGQGPCKCGSSCCDTGEYCCGGACQATPCEECTADGDCLFVLLSGCCCEPDCELVGEYVYFENSESGFDAAVAYAEDYPDCGGCVVTYDVAGACCDGACYPSSLPARLTFPGDFASGETPACP